MSISTSFLSIAVVCLCWLSRSAECVPTDDAPPDIVRFQSELQPEVGLRFVRNSGVCETTPGVGQISGYADIGKNMSMVCNFVYQNLALINLVAVVLVFRGQGESRDCAIHAVVCYYHMIDPEHIIEATFATRINGGPGSSSMVGIFQGAYVC